MVRAWATRSSSFESALLRFRASSCLSSCFWVCSARSMAAARFSSVTPRRAEMSRQQLLGALVVGEGGRAGDGFDAAHSGGGGLLDGNLEYADVAGAPYVRAAAKLLAVKAARRRTGREWSPCGRFVPGSGRRKRPARRKPGRRPCVVTSVWISLFRRISSFTCCSMSRSSAGSIAGKVREVEAQARWLDQRAGLLDVRAQNVAQRRVHQVRGRVIALDVLAARAVGFARDADRPRRSFSFAKTRCATRPETG